MLNIYNTSSSGKLYFNIGTSGSTATRWLEPRQNVNLKISEDLNVYATGDTVQIQIMEIR